jgi:hypothetical protein
MAAESTAGYSGTPLARKLGINAGTRVRLVNPPAALPETLQTHFASRLEKELDVVLLFADSLAGYKRDFGHWMQAIHPDGAIWVAWPKKASGVPTELTEELVRSFALTTPFVDVKVCAIDATWSGLKFVVRKELRASFAAVRR